MFVEIEGEKALVDPTVLQAAFDPAKVDQSNPWAIFEAYLDAAVARVNEVVAPRWTGILCGADVFTDENAFTMSEEIRGRLREPGALRHQALTRP